MELKLLLYMDIKIKYSNTRLEFSKLLLHARNFHFETLSKFNLENIKV